MTFLAQFRIGETDFFLARTEVRLEGEPIQCVAIKNSVDDEQELISLDALDDEVYMRGNMADKVLKWMYDKAREPFVPHEPYRVWLATTVRTFVESTGEKE